MDYLITKQDIGIGEILRVYIDKKFEGWARLLEPSGKPVSYIDNNAVYVKEKWRVEFVNPEEIPGNPSEKEIWNQRFLKGFRTFRHFSYFAALSWEKYVAVHGNPKEIKRVRMFLNRKNEDENAIC